MRGEANLLSVAGLFSCLLLVVMVQVGFRFGEENGVISTVGGRPCRSDLFVKVTAVYEK